MEPWIPLIGVAIGSLTTVAGWYVAHRLERRRRLDGAKRQAYSAFLGGAGRAQFRAGAIGRASQDMFSEKRDREVVLKHLEDWATAIKEMRDLMGEVALLAPSHVLDRAGDLLDATLDLDEHWGKDDVQTFDDALGKARWALQEAVQRDLGIRA